MFKSCRNFSGIILTLLLSGLAPGLLSAAEDERSFSAHNDDYATMYELVEGDTPERVAEKFLGDAAFAEELLHFNQLKRHEFKALVVKVIAIPGKIRTQAMTQIRATKQARDAAHAAQAPKFAAEPFKSGAALYALSEKSLQAGAYDQARHLAIQARNKFNEALALADENAPVQEKGRIVVMHGAVQLSDDGGITWTPLNPKIPVKKGDTVLTGPLSRVQIQLADGGTLKLLENSRLEFTSLRVDPRTGERKSVLDLWTGTLHTRLAPLDRPSASFEINMAGASIAAKGAHMKLERTGKRSGWLALFKGQALVSTNNQELFLPVHKGLTLSGGKISGNPVPLLEPPFITDPEIPEHHTAVQHPQFTWRETGTRNPGAYRLEIARDPGMVKVVQNQVLAGDTYKADLLEEGTYYWQVSTIDRNGIEGMDAEPATLEIKKNLDVMIMQKEQALDVGGRQIVSPKHLFFAQAAQADTSVVSFDYQINQQERQTLPRFFRLQGEGQMVIRVWGIGADGEQGPQQQIHVYVDRTPPAVTCLVDSRLTGSAEKREQAVIMIKARDPAGVDSLEYSLDNDPFQPYTVPLEIDMDREVLLRYRATDGVNNVSPAKSLRIYPSEQR